MRKIRVEIMWEDYPRNTSANPPRSFVRVQGSAYQGESPPFEFNSGAPGAAREELFSLLVATLRKELLS